MGSIAERGNLTRGLTLVADSAIPKASRKNGEMELLPDELRRQLPLIRKQHNHADEDFCMISVKFFTPHSGVSFYVAEGEQRHSDYVLWGFLVTPQLTFPSRFQITLGRLKTGDWLGGEPCERDENFKPARWGAIKRTLRNLRQLPGLR